MHRVFFLLLMSFYTLEAALCSGDPRPQSPCAGWESLQQLNSLMPERIWEQEFSIIVDQKGFERVIPEWTLHQRREGMHQCRIALPCSNEYFLRSTMSGENTRLLDRYQEFEWSPYWKNPPRVSELRALEIKILEEIR